MRSILLVFCTLIACVTYGQKTISGKVTDAKDAQPLAGVSIKAKGANTTAITNTDGSYTIRVADGVKFLVFSYVGYQDKEEAITGNTLDVSLSVAEQSLNDVVVVGYGTRIARDVTGSVAKVGAKEITNTPATSFESAMQGRAAGVQVSQQNGKVGQAINIRIRGASSVSAGNEPLYVVDGIPITGGNNGDNSSNGASTNALADLNMNDIESIQILKDASSAAIYGSQGSNGVVLITTKKGRAGTSKIDFGYYTGLQYASGKREFLNGKQWVDYFERAGKGAADLEYAYGYYNTKEEAEADWKDYVESRFDRYSAGTDAWKEGKTVTDWQDEAFQRAPISQYDLNISGGTDKTKYYMSGQYLDQTGILIANGYKRYSARINVDQQINNWLSGGMNLSFARSNNKRVSNDDQFSTPLQMVALSPVTPVIDPRTGLTSGALDPASGSPNTNYPVYYNPLLSVENGFYHTLVNRTVGNVYLNASLAKGLVFRSEFGMDQLNQVEEEYQGRLTARNTGVPDGYGANFNTEILAFNTNNFFNYKKTFGSNDIDAVLGMAFQSREYQFADAKAEEYPSDAYKKLSGGASKTGAYSYATSNTLLSYFARVNYKLKDKYLLALSGRIDGSSRFGADNKYGFFPAVSAGWILTEEKFLSGVKWLNFLKLRASYGLTGNDNIPDFASRGLYTSAAYGGQAGQVPQQLSNPNLKWETTAGTDIGLQGEVFNNILSFDIAYYKRDTRDLLLNVDVPSTTGYTSKFENVGKLYNKGIEVTLTSTNINTKNLRWTTTLNFAYNKNKITYLAGQLLGDDVNKAKEGEPLGVFYTREYAGVDPQTGDALYYKNTIVDGKLDRSTTNDYNEAQDVVVGDPNPHYIYGFENAVTFKGFELDVLLQGVAGNKIYNGGGQYMSAEGSNGFDNQTTDQLGYWDKPGDKTMVPEPRLFYPNGTDPSSRYLSDGSYLRVKEVSLAYTVPKAVFGKLKVDRLRLYVRAQNLFTITKYKGWDPEVNADYQASNINLGQDFYSAPQFKTFVIGVNLGL
ncbi:MAG TPA: TonB-dependent receptor [Chitinophagaceae bacterium]|nr:TonB-dependent receptor [Chitinophagaceae bacterium]